MLMQVLMPTEPAAPSSPDLSSQDSKGSSLLLASPVVAKWLPVFWLAVCAPLTFHVLQSWYSCLAQKTVNDVLIPILSIVIINGAVRQYLLKSPPFRFSLDVGGLIFLAAMAAVNCAGNYLHLFRIYWLSFTAMSFGMLWALAGKRYARHWLPVFLFSVELLPGGPAELVSSASAWLRVGSVEIARALSTIFIPLVVKNNYFFIKGQPIEITPACSGLSMLTGLIFVVLLWQLVCPMRLRTVFVLFAAALGAAVLSNGTRLCITALVAYHCSIDTAIAIHSNLEYVLFPVVMILLWTCKRLVQS